MSSGVSEDYELLNYWKPRCAKYQYEKWKPFHNRMLENKCSIPCKELLKYQYIKKRNKKTENMIAYIMKNSLGIKALQQFGFDIVKENRQVIYDLCWYLIMSHNLEMKYDRKKITFLTFCETETLIEILGPNFVGYLENRNRASLIFSILAGVWTPEYRNIEEWYSEIPSNILFYYLTETQIYDDKTMRKAPPYSYIDPDDYEELTILKNVNSDNVYTYIDKYGFMSGKPINNYVKFFVNELFRLRFVYVDKHVEEFYQQFDVFNYTSYNHINNSYDLNIGPIPTYYELKSWCEKSGKRFDWIFLRDMLQFYKTREIVEEYEPIGEWGDRNDLFKLIVAESTKRLFRIKGNFCQNLDMLNLTTLLPHTEDNPTYYDPIISYGYPGKYRCYQLSELEQTFRVYSDDGMFHFRVPDYLPNTIDEITGGPAEKDFSIESIKQLQELISNDFRFVNLRNIINTGLDTYDNSKNKILSIVKNLEGQSFQRKYIIHLYLMWLFLFGMWLRQWKGPGYDWPFNGLDNEDLEYKCNIETRDENFRIQMLVHDAILRLANFENMNDYISDLPIISYNFFTKDMIIANEDQSVFTKIEEIINAMNRGEFCLAHGSDIILQTSYYLLFKILELKSEDDFNVALHSLSPMVNETERRIVLRLIKIGNPFNMNSKILHDKLNSLANPLIYNKPFMIGNLTSTKHIDPEFGKQLVFDVE